MNLICNLKKFSYYYGKKVLISKYPLNVCHSYNLSNIFIFNFNNFRHLLLYFLYSNLNQNLIFSICLNVFKLLIFLYFGIIIDFIQLKVFYEFYLIIIIIITITTYNNLKLLS